MERVLDIQSNFIPTSDSPYHLYLARFGGGGVHHLQPQPLIPFAEYL